MLKYVSSNMMCCGNKVLAFLFLVFLSSIVEAQEIWTTDQFLNHEIDEGEIPYQESLDFLNNRAKGMPLVDRYDFRTETDELQLERQRFQFRLKLNSNDERKAYNGILSANKERYKWHQDKYKLRLWEAKYNNVINLFFNQKEMQLVGQELELLEDVKTVLRKILTNEAQIDVTDWIANEEELFSTRSDSVKLALRKKEIIDLMFGEQERTLSIDESNWIEISNIPKVIDEVLKNETTHPDVNLALAEEKVAGAEYNLELAESKRWLEFVQVQYQSDDDLSFQKELSFGTSITLPSKNNNRVKKNDAALEFLEKSFETRDELQKNSKDILAEYAKIKSLIVQYEELEKMRKSQNLESLFDTYAEKKIVSPLLLLNLKLSMVSNAKKKLNLEKNIYERYVDLLSKKAAFLTEPQKNYLKN